MARRLKEESKQEGRDRRAALAAVVSKSKTFRPAYEVLKRVRSVPTIFPQLDYALRVGGWPIERLATIHGPSNEGKALASTTPILTPTGWVEIGSLKVNDRVIASDGAACRVIGVFPQGQKQLFQVTFNDNSTIECCDEHLWLTTTRKERLRGTYARGPRPARVRIKTGVEGKGSVKSTAEIRDGFITGDHEIPIVAAIEFEASGELPLHPYVMGLLLGDGGFTGVNVCLHNPELDIRSRFATLLPAGDTVSEVDEVTLRVKRSRRDGPSAVRVLMSKLGLMDCRSYDKFIPEMYLLSRREDRLELLRGLLDTDGFVTAIGRCVEYTSTSPRLARDVAFVARSLGALVVVDRSRCTSFSYRGENKRGRPSTRMRIYFDDGTVPVSSVKHLAKWRSCKGTKRRHRRVMIDIQPSRVADAVCIAVDSQDRTFVAKDFIVTHNTLFTHGLGLSFLRKEHYYLHVDAERTTPITWLEGLFGEYASSDIFLAARPESYEDTVDAVREFVTDIATARAKNQIPKDTTALIVIDSLRKLVPKDFFKKIAKGASAEGIDGNKGRSGMLKAKLNSAWVDELIPLLDDTSTAMIFIAREYENAEADPWADDYKVGGGKAVYYDSSLSGRVERSWVYGPGKEGERRPVYGERHRVTVKKTKVAGKESKTVVAAFHSSNGTLVPAGFDRARDVVELGRKLDIIHGEGWLSWNKKRWNGENAATVALTKNPEMLAELEAVVRAHFEREGGDVVDADGVVR